MAKIFSQAQMDEIYTYFKDKMNSLECIRTYEILPFAECTFSQIEKIVNAYYSGYLKLEEIQNVWNIGDEIEINTVSVSTMESQPSQIIHYKIIDFEHDTLLDQINDKTKALLTLAPTTKLTNNGIISSDYVNYPLSDRHKWLNNDYYNALPEQFRNLIKTVNKSTNAGTFNAKVFLPSVKEITGNDTDYPFGGVRYDYYKNHDYPSQSWTRNPYNSNCYTYYWVNYGTTLNYSNPNGTYKGIVPHICL